MAKAQSAEQEVPATKPLLWLHGAIKTPPFTREGRQEAGMLLRLLQQGERLGMPQAEPLPDVGPRCGALRVRDAEHNWRIMYRIDSDAVLILEVYSTEDPGRSPDEDHRAVQAAGKTVRRGSQCGNESTSEARTGSWTRQNEKRLKRRVGRLATPLNSWE